MSGILFFICASYESLTAHLLECDNVQFQIIDLISLGFVTSCYVIMNISTAWTIDKLKIT